MTRVDVKEVIGAETSPARDGAALGQYVVSKDFDLTELELDVSDLAPEDLVSSFVNSFLHEIETKRSGSIASATRIRWHARFPSEADRLRELTSYYVQDVFQKR